MQHKQHLEWRKGSLDSKLDCVQRLFTKVSTSAGSTFSLKHRAACKQCSFQQFLLQIHHGVPHQRNDL